MHHMHPNRLEIYGRLEGASAATGTSQALSVENARSFGGQKRKGVTPTVPRPSLESLNLIESLISLFRIRDEVANWLTTGAIGFLSRSGLLWKLLDERKG